MQLANLIANRHSGSMKIIAFSVSMLGLVACTAPNAKPVETPIPPKAVNGQTCNASKIQTFVGQPLSSAEKTLLLQPVRVIRPNQMVTMDYLEGRLNILVDENELIRRVYCG